MSGKIKNSISIYEQTNNNLADAETKAVAPLECTEKMAEKY